MREKKPCPLLITAFMLVVDVIRLISDKIMEKWNNFNP